MRVSTSDKNRQKPVKYVFLWALEHVYVSTHTSSTRVGAQHVLELPRSKVGLGTDVVRRRTRVAHHVCLCGDPPHTLKRVDEQNGDKAAVARRQWCSALHEDDGRT